MPTIGVSKPYYAIRNVSNLGVVSYVNGASMGKLTEINVEVEASQSNPFYADNALDEDDKTFAGGSLTTKTNDLSQEVSKAILGLVEQALTNIPGITDTNVKELIYDDDQNIPHLGVGFIIKKKVNGTVKWRGIVLYKVKYDTPADAATTQGETIEWQVPELKASIARDELQNGKWKTEATLSTEAQAEAYVKYRLGMTQQQEQEEEDNP